MLGLVGAIFLFSLRCRGWCARGREARGACQQCVIVRVLKQSPVRVYQSVSTCLRGRLGACVPSGAGNHADAKLPQQRHAARATRLGSEVEPFRSSCLRLLSPAGPPRAASVLAPRRAPLRVLSGWGWARHIFTRPPQRQRSFPVGTAAGGVLRSSPSISPLKRGETRRSSARLLGPGAAPPLRSCSCLCA